MTYTNGISNLQHLTGTVGAAATGISTETKRPSLSTGSNGASTLSGLDQASLSSASALVGQALGGSDVRTATVSALQAAIASGSYHVSSSDVADKLITSLLN